MTVLHIHSLQDRNSDLKHQQSTLRKQWSNGSEALKQTTWNYCGLSITRDPNEEFQQNSIKNDVEMAERAVEKEVG